MIMIGLIRFSKCRPVDLFVRWNIFFFMRMNCSLLHLGNNQAMCDEPGESLLVNAGKDTSYFLKILSRLTKSRWILALFIKFDEFVDLFRSILSNRNFFQESDVGLRIFSVESHINRFFVSNLLDIVFISGDGDEFDFFLIGYRFFLVDFHDEFKWERTIVDLRMENSLWSTRKTEWNFERRNCNVTFTLYAKVSWYSRSRCFDEFREIADGCFVRR